MYVVVGYDDDGNPIWGEEGAEVGTDFGEELPEGLIRLGGPEDIISNAVDSVTVGSDVIYRLADGSAMGLNTETGEYYPLTSNQLKTITSGEGSASSDTLASLRGQGVALGGSGGNAAFNRVVNQVKGFFKKPDGSTDWAKVATAAAGLYRQFGGGDVKTGGYNRPVPQLTATRGEVGIQDPNRRPGQGGLRYFTDIAYTPKGDTEALAAAQQASVQQAQGLRAAYTPTAAPAAASPFAGSFAMPWAKPAPTQAPAPTQPASEVAGVMRPEDRMASGGIAMLAKGGRYLDGDTDGMADELRTTIDGQQPAALSHGEFVIPADVVAHFGNGNSNAGAKKLEEMMARVRKARTGTEEQGKEIDPDKFMPGGLAGYAGGGMVAFQAGGPTGSGTGGSSVTGYGTSSASTLSPWAGEYVTDLLGEGRAAASQPYQAYQGPLTAGASPLQQQAFAGASEMAQTGYTPGSFQTGTFDLKAAQQYMNPYLQAALDPTLAEMRRQSDIARLSDASRLTKAGAYGGSRQAIMESEGRRNLLDKQRQTIGEGYSSAFDKAMGQFNAEQGRGLDAQRAAEQSRQFGAEFGAKSLADLANLGATQRTIEQEGIAADRKAFEQERDYPFSMVEFKRGLLKDLPIGATTTTPNTTDFSQLTQSIADLQALYDNLRKLGVTTPAPAPSPAPSGTPG